VKLLISTIIFLFAVQSYTQTIIISDSVSYQEVKSCLFHNPINITFKNDTVLHCYLRGIKDDALFVSDKKSILKVPLSEVIKIAVDDSYIAGWTIGGLYLGQCVFFSWVGVPNAAPVYWNVDMAFLYRGFFSLLSLGAGVVACAITHEIEGNEIFSFTGSKEEVNAEIEKLTEFLLVDKPVKNKFQLSFESAFVNTTYSNTKNSDVYKEENFSPVPTKFNLMRKIQAVYSVSSNVDVGAAFVFTGEPSFTWQRYTGVSEGSVDLVGNSSYSGYGIYPVFQYNLTNSFPSLFFDVVAGGGPGIAKISQSISQYESNKYTYHSIDKIIFTGYLFTNVRFRINPTTLIALSADYVFIPEKKLPIDYLNIKAESFSNFSYGISFLFEM
jgi:hypothetical protein